MNIRLIQEAQTLVNAGWVNKMKTQKYSSFCFEQSLWNEEPLLIKSGYKDDAGWDIYRSNFVGILWDRDTLVLSIPKAVHLDKHATEEQKRELLSEYARLLDLYFAEVKEKAKEVNFIPQSPWYVDRLEIWCSHVVESQDPQVIAAVKFEKVFEWMLGWLYRNQIELRQKSVLFASRYLEKKKVDINQQSYHTYGWVAVNKRTETGSLEDRKMVFENQEKVNIPDIVCEIDLENSEAKQCCCVIDAKYSGWYSETSSYKLPPNRDIYKQFFYQEQFRRIYEAEGKENIAVYNLLVLPDYLGDTKDKILRQCGTIGYRYHQEHTVAVLQVNVEKLIKACSNREESVREERERFMKLMLENNKKITALTSKNRGNC